MKKSHSGATFIGDYSSYGKTRIMTGTNTKRKMLENKLANGGEVENRRERKLFEKMMKQQQKQMKEGQQND